MRILLVEDNPGDVELVRIRLRSEQAARFTLEHAECLADGIAQQRRNPADVVLLDLHLPDSSGLETIRAFRDADGEAPVVVLTGSDDLETAIEALRNGADDYLVKSELPADVLRRACGYAIERRRGLCELQAAMRARDQLLQVVSHDLRNHIGTIEVGMRLLRMATTVEDVQRRLGPIERASGTVRRLLEDLVDMAAIEKGVLVVNPSWTEVNRLLREAHALFAPVAEEKGVKLEVEGDEGDASVWVDSVRITQVLGNLIGNALKFTPRGGTVTLLARSGTESVVMAVRDTGPGIPEGDRARIFERFFRGSRPPAGPGAGLGLAIARGLVQAHGGRIWVETAEGRGTMFQFSVPREPSGAAVRAAAV